MPQILYGRHPVLEALRAGRRLRRLLLAPGLPADPKLAEIVSHAASVGVQPESVPRDRLRDVAHTEHHQGVAAYFDGRQLGGLGELRDLLERDRPGWPALLLCLDEVQDPQNAGALARTAEACRVTGVVLPRHRSSPLSPAVAKASAGAVEHLPVLQVANLRAALLVVRETGGWIVGLDAAGSERYDQVDYRGPTALVVGAEGHGLRPLIRETCDHLVRLPMGGRVASLNAAVAGSLLLYEAARQRGFEFPAGAGGDR
ncbi:MAG TPA: 23S rRNA (guanosine(2251)-2'-O)-methyltransferase RlmB [Candidatus Dormibacteraeota bacterium]|nr:23S rRNA (guanosine(2251)-2'-O)-methyltransferase RlmB [Candidatus Dormibacteraeota bacterium]